MITSNFAFALGAPINAELALLVAIPILSATLPLFLGLKFDRVGWPVALVVAVVEVLLAAYVLGRIVTERPGQGEYVHNLGGYPRQYGIELVADPLSAMVVALVAVVTLAVLVYARRGGPRRNSFYAAYLLLCGGLMGTTLTGDVFNLFVFLEITGLATYALVAAGRTGRSALAAFKYLLIGTAGASLYLVGVGYVFVATGTLNMIELQTAIPETVGYTDPLVVASFAFVAVGLGVKSAIFPLHTWMPDAYADSPDTVTAFISGLVSTVGAYALGRLIFTVYTVEFFHEVPLAQELLVGVATVSIVAGSVLAVMQADVKRMLAYSSVSHFGMIVAAFALANEAAILGGVIHLVGHGLMKTGLFVAVGVIATVYGVRTVTDYANLGYRSPITAAAIGLLGLALVGIPPSIGFLGKWYIAIGAVEAGAWPVAAVIFLSTLLTLLYIARLLEVLYFRPAEDATVDFRGAVLTDGGVGVRGASIGMVAVAAAVAIAAVGLGFAGPLFEHAIEPFVESAIGGGS